MGTRLREGHPLPDGCRDKPVDEECDKGAFSIARWRMPPSRAALRRK
jgi:hypothetical protein